MSRSGYSDDLEPWALIRWRGAVNAAIKGKRGQQLLRDLASALDEMPVKRLIRHKLRDENGEVCALGALGQKRGLPLGQIDPYEHEDMAGTFCCARALIAEIEFENDDGYASVTPEHRWQRMRSWVAQHIGEAP